MSVITEPQLQPPGAGLPALENFFLRHVYFPVYSRMTSVNKALVNFEKTTLEISQLIQDLSPEQQQRRVLIDRLVGIEDSSRNWSPLMVLEHLILVNQGICQIVTSLAKGQTPDMQVRIADVKPRGTLGSDGNDVFVRKMNETAECLHQIPNWSEAEHLFHPWLGFLTARQWTAVLAMHQRLHKRQIEAIIATGTSI